MADVTTTFASISSTESSNSPSGSTTIGTGLDDNLRTMQAHVGAFRDATGWGGLKLSSVAGTNTITASVAAQGSITMAPTAYATGQRFHFIPAATNTGATTININSLGAKNIFFAGAACVGSELTINVPAVIEYDGTQFHIIGNGFVPRRLTQGTEQATTSGTSIDFTGIPSWVQRITIQFVGVSTNGTDNWLIQIGDSGGIEATGYLGSGSTLSGTDSATNFTAGYGLEIATAAAVVHGTVVLTVEDAANFTWVASGVLGRSDAGAMHMVAGSKSLSAALDRVRITTSNGTDTFDAGAINVLYE